MQEFWYDYVKQKYGEKAESCLNRYIVLNSNDGKRMQSINSKEACPYETREDLVSEKEEIKRNNIIKQYKNN